MNTLEKMQSDLVKFEKLIYFVGADENGSDLMDLFQDHDDKNLTEALGFDTTVSTSGLYVSLEDAGYTGYFFANAHTPIRKYHEKGSTGFMFGWGHTTFKLVFARTFDELVDKAVSWAKGKHEEMKDE